MVEYTSEYVRCQNDIEFLGDMQSMNRGGMTLVNKNYFDFGFKLLEIVSSKLTQDDLQNKILLASKISNQKFWKMMIFLRNSG